MRKCGGDKIGQQLNILVMAAHLHAAQACIQSFGRAGHSVFVTHSREASPNAFSKFVKERIPVVPDRDTTESRSRSLLSVIEKHAIDLVVPIHDSDAVVAAAARDNRRCPRVFVLPPTESVLIAASKIRTFALAQKLGIRAPKSVVAADVNAVRSIVGREGLPIVVKLPIATASSGTFILRTSRQLEDRLSKLPAGPYLVQSLVAGRPLGITGFADKGRLVDSFIFEPLRDENQSGTPTYALSVSNPALTNILEQLCRGLQWSGGIDVDVVIDATGDLYLLEINPRFSGTLIFADKMGIDLPSYYVTAVSGSEATATPHGAVPEGVLFVSFFPNEIAAISLNPSVMQPKASAMRRGRTIVDNLYPEDGPLMAEQMKRGLFLAWNAPRR